MVIITDYMVPEGGFLCTNVKPCTASKTMIYLNLKYSSSMKYRQMIQLELLCYRCILI